MSAVVAVLATAVGATAQEAVESPDGGQGLSVPLEAFRALEIDPRDPLPLTRAIRVLHSVPRPDRVPVHVTELEKLLADLDRLSSATAHGTYRATLAMASTGGAARAALREMLSATGLRLREQRGAYTIEMEPGGAAVALRERLRKADIDAGDVAARLTAGEALLLAPSSTAAPRLLPLEAWTTVLAGPVSSDTLFATLVRDRRASLLYYGLQQLTPGTRAYFGANPRFVRWLYENAPAAFAAFGGAFQVDAEGHVRVPGGGEAAAVWEDLVGERVSRPDRFGRALFSRDAGRLAYLFHTVAALDEPRQRFALGLWMPDLRDRRNDARQLARAFAVVDPQWSLPDVPFSRPPHDPAVLLATIAVSAGGLPTAPASIRFWERAFESEELPEAKSSDVRERASDRPITAGWIAGVIAGRRGVDRRALLERLSFGQRLFAGASGDALGDVLVAVRAFARYPSAMLALESIGVRTPAVYAAVARHALALERIEDPRRALPLLAQFQGAVALLERIARTGAADTDALERLVTTLAAIPLVDRGYDGGIAGWLRDELLPALFPASSSGTASAEDRLLSALADRPGASRTFDWEGDSYVLDGRPAFDRLTAAHARQRSNSLDVVLALYAHIDALRHGEHTIEALHARAITMREDAIALLEPRAWPEAPDSAPRARQAIERAAQELARITRPRDTPGARRIGEQLVGVADYLLGEVMVALAYAPALGDPETILGPQGDLAHRHTFGVSARAISAAQAIRRVAWQRPSRGSRVSDGEALTGAVPGVESALAHKQLRRLSTDRLPGPSRLNSNDISAFVRTAALLNPARLDDTGLAEIARAVEAGRARVQRAARERTLDGLALEVRMSPDRRQWLSQSAPPDAGESVFSLPELFLLGGGRTEDVSDWGISGEPVLGCRCLWFPPPGLVDVLNGRASTHVLGAFLIDLSLSVASHMAALRAPAGLFPAVMSIALQEFIDEVPARFEDDWVALSGYPKKLRRERVEDFVSAAIAHGAARPFRAEGPS